MEDKKDKPKEELDFTYFEEKESWEFSEKLKTHSAKASSALKNFVGKLGTEAKETHAASKIMVKYLRGDVINEEEEKELKTQIFDLFKMAGIGIPFMVIPGSTVLIPYLVKLAKKRGINLLPTAFKEENKEDDEK